MKLELAPPTTVSGRRPIRRCGYSGSDGTHRTACWGSQTWPLQSSTWRKG